MTNGTPYGSLEFAEKALLRTLRRANLARVVDGRVQFRNASDVGYPVEYQDAILAGKASPVVRDWLASQGI